MHFIASFIDPSTEDLINVIIIIVIHTESERVYKIARRGPFIALHPVRIGDWRIYYLS